MAYANTTVFSATATSGVQGFFARITEGLANRRLYNKTFNELSKLSNRELNDLGLSRSGIAAIARESVYGV
ncbi:DUF1127 domain-containing protein [Halocynthiibacter namhaensis]|uniref:DUF1127 domain-containing protein n=1 Tax=Halocynthiibacter namhaensis TaxID=1290553 RepID=UPI00057960DF|nr:DUF1127 domain-containing protein [Halocynthiibacter namhaensis]